VPDAGTFIRVDVSVIGVEVTFNRAEMLLQPR
jgi:hypothetical protein